MATKWTENQRKAIDASPSVLVNAAAGSGKTAVLVQRIMEKIIKGETDIDRLLVVTFARDAAAEMKTRIKKALVLAMKESEDEGFCRKMRKQLRLINQSEITTIDAFCINVVKKHFHLLGIDPVFSITDADEAKIILEEMVKEFTEELYEAKDERIKFLSECYSEKFGDYTLQKMIEEIYTFTRSLPETKEWIKEKVLYYKDYKNSPWYEKSQNELSEIADEMEKIAENAAKTMIRFALGTKKEIEELSEEEMGILEEYDNKGLWQTILEDLSKSRSLKTASGDEGISIVKSFEKSSKKLGGDFKEERKAIIDIRNEIAEKKAPGYLKICGMSEETLKHMYEEGIYPQVSVLGEIVCEFEDFYYEKKIQKNTFEFNDLEHFAYKLLRDFPEVRQEYNEKFDEILMDEYQDTNALQEGIFDLISNKRFMVGDMKQSIYRFRNSDPMIFKSRDNLYKENPDEGNRIILSENFRSRPEVLDSVNFIFSRIMSETAGEVEYDDSQALKWGNLTAYGGEKPEDYTSELYILEGRPSDAEEDENDIVVEARFVAKKIREMIDKGFLVSDSDGGFRPVNEGDFAIIQSAVKQSGEIFMSELKKVGLNGYAENEGYFEKIEISIMMSLIEVINNPLRDIPLVALMRSVMFAFTDDELARIRVLKKGDFYRAVEEAAEREDELGKKCRGFCDSITRWRGYAKYMSADRLIWTIYEQTDFYDLMGVLYEGEEAQANLRLLFEKARQYEKSGFRGLSNFVDYINKLKENGKVASATVLSDNKKVIRIMTIHKSKGLEFPVCFFVRAGKKFNSEKSGRLRLHKDLGIGVRYVEPKLGFFTTTPASELIKKTKDIEEQAEELRKLYVALTRAKEKLIIVGTIKAERVNSKGEVIGGYKNAREKWNKLYSPTTGIMEPGGVNSAKSYIDLIAPVVLAHKKDSKFLNYVIPYNPERETVEEDERVKYCGEGISRELIDELLDSGSKVLSSREIPAKISVTGIEKLKAQFETEDDVQEIQLEGKYTENQPSYRADLKKPAFLNEKKLSGAARGTAYHSVLAHIEIKTQMSTDFIKKELQRLKDSGIISVAEFECINPDDIEKFFSGALGQRIRKSPRVFREEPFEILADASKVIEIVEQYDEKILIQGVIDCMFEEDNNLVIVDFKTDKGLSCEELMEHYRTQLNWYKIAAESLCEKKVSDGILYSFAKHEEIKVF